MKNVLKIIVLLFLIFPLYSFAYHGEEILPASYVFHLYFDNGQLSADRDFQLKYDVSTDPYTQPVLVTSFPYRGEVINFVGETAAQFTFDPRNGDANFNRGKVSVKAPYVSDAQRVVFYNPQNQAVLTIPVDASSFCNDDGICNADMGEDYGSCPRDCKSASLPAISTTPAPQSGAGTSALTLGILYLLVGLVLLAGLWWLFKRRGAGSGPILPPPTPPSPGNVEVRGIGKFSKGS